MSGFTIACSSARGTSCKGCCCSFHPQQWCSTLTDADICRCSSVGSCMDRESAENKRRRRLTRSGTTVCLAERANTSRLHRLNASATFQQRVFQTIRICRPHPTRARSRTLFDRISTSMEISMLISCVRKIFLAKVDGNGLTFWNSTAGRASNKVLPQRICTS